MIITPSRRYAAAILMLLMGWCMTNSAVWTGMRKMQYAAERTAARTGMARDTIVVSASASMHYIAEDEVRYMGRMFDIEQKIPIAGDIMLVGHYDATDSLLFEWLEQVFEEDDEERNQDAQRTPWQPEATLYSFEMLLTNTNLLPAKMHSDLQRVYYRSQYLSDPFQPPKG